MNHATRRCRCGRPLGTGERMARLCLNCSTGRLQGIDAQAGHALPLSTYAASSSGGTVSGPPTSDTGGLDNR